MHGALTVVRGCSGGGASRYDRGVFLGGSERDADKLDVSGVVRGNGLMHNAASWGRVFEKGMEINTKHCGLLTQTMKSCEQ